MRCASQGASAARRGLWPASHWTQSASACSRHARADPSALTLLTDELSAAADARVVGRAMLCCARSHWEAVCQSPSIEFLNSRVLQARMGSIDAIHMAGSTLQPGHGFSGVLACWRHTLAREGPRALFRGVTYPLATVSLQARSAVTRAVSEPVRRCGCSDHPIPRVLCHPLARCARTTLCTSSTWLRATHRDPCRTPAHGIEGFGSPGAECGRLPGIRRGVPPYPRPDGRPHAADLLPDLPGRCSTCQVPAAHTTTSAALDRRTRPFREHAQLLTSVARLLQNTYRSDFSPRSVLHHHIAPTEVQAKHASVSRI